MAFCSKCGAEVGPGAAFCAKCGQATRRSCARPNRERLGGGEIWRKMSPGCCPTSSVGSPV